MASRPRSVPCALCGESIYYPWKKPQDLHRGLVYTFHSRCHDNYVSWFKRDPSVLRKGTGRRAGRRNT